MAAQISLVRRDDFTSDIESLSLWNYAAGFSIGTDGWAPGRAAPSDVSVTEALTLQAKGTSPDNLAANLQALDVFLKKASWYNDPQELYGVWLRVQQPRETGARQALITGARLDKAPLWSHTAQNGPGGAALYGYGNFVQAHGLALDRIPYWESTTAVDYASGAALSTVGGTADYTTYGGSPGAVVGDVPARLAQIAFQGVNGGGGPLQKFWMGFRTNRFGNRLNFTPNWRIENASTFDTDTSGNATHADATAKFGFKTVTTFATVSTLLRRTKSSVKDMSANPTDQRGTFMVLLRAKLAAAGQVNVRLTDGLFNSPSLAARDRVPITSTSWQFYELGTVNIPSPARVIASLDMISYYALAIDAELITGTPNTTNLEMDCLTLIPMNEGWCSVDITNANSYGVQYSLGDLQPLYVQDRPDGTKAAVWVANSNPQIVGAPRLSGGLPVGNGVVVLAAQRNGVSTLADTLNLDIQVYNRWVTMRGAS